MQERWADHDFKDAMAFLSFRLEESLKEDVNLLAGVPFERRLESKSSAGAVARAFIAAGLEQIDAVPRFSEVSEAAASPEARL